MTNNIAVIGGGASGLIAAITAKRLGAFVTVYEKNERVGKKLLSTGNGRCNLTNNVVSVSDYHGQNSSFCKTALREFTKEDTIRFFSELGLLTKVEEDGKVYPYCDRATAVLDVLRAELERLDINVVTSFEVKDIIKRKNAFEIVSYDNRHEFADKVILSSGGKAGVGCGGTLGYDILKKLGHKITPLSPSIVQLKTDNKNLIGMKGIKCQALLTLGGISKFGELLFTDNGLSGPPAFFVSSYYNESNGTAEIDFFAETDEKALFSIIKSHTELFDTLENLFTGILHKKIGQAILKECGFAPLSSACSSLSYKDIALICKTAKHFKTNITGTMSWNNAQVTKGGVCTDEIDENSMMSKKCKNLFVTGELLDIDGNCGGFNLQWAWSSGCLAGRYCVLND